MINKKVLILAENLEVNRTSSGLRSNKQVLLYQRYFNDVEVLTTTPLEKFKQIKGVKYSVINLENIKTTFLSKIPKLKAIFVYTTGFCTKDLKIIKLWSKSTIGILENEHKDLVVVLGTGLSHLVSIAMYSVNKNLYGKYLQFIHDPYPQSLYPDPYRIPKNIIQHILKKKFQKILDKADILSYPSLDLQIWMQQFYGNHLAEKSIVQHHIGLSKSELEPILTTESTQSIRLNKGLNITHTGTLIGHREPRFLFKALEILLKNYPDAKNQVFINVIGKVTNDWSHLKVESKNINIIEKRITYAESLDVQENSDVLFTIEPVAKISPIMHGKMADYFTFNKPILALTSKQSENARLLGYDYTLSVENGDLNAIYKALELIYLKFINKQLDSLNVSITKRKKVFPDEWVKKLSEVL